MLKLSKEIKINLIIGIFVALIMVIFLYKIYDTKNKAMLQNKAGTSPIIPVEVAVVKRGDIEIVRVFTSNIEAEQAVEVKPRVAGQIKEVYVEMGDKVKMDQPVVRLDDNDSKQVYEQKKAALEVVQVSLQKAEMEREDKKKAVEKAQSLFEKKLISQQETEKTETEYKNAEINYLLQEAELNQKNAELKQATLLLENNVIKAPFSGYIGGKFIEVGALVSPSTVIATLVAIDNVKAQIDVDEKDLIMLFEQMPIKATVETYPNRVFDGIIERISPVLDSTTHLGKVQIKISNANKLLKPGMFAKIRVSIKSQTNALVIPVSAIINKDGEDIVYLAREGKALERKVKLGVNDGERMEVISGVDEGEWVIVIGQQTLQDGFAINVQKRT